jgi:hypothetical protein
MMGERVEHGGCHLLMPEDLRPLTKGEIGRDNDRRPLIEFRDKMEEEL